jgi:hypothetical protein
VRRFLLETKRGACSEFATAMVVLLRLVGVPARLAVGYAVDPIQRDRDGTWTVHASDAHAWVEVPLEGAGFVTYDPTSPQRAEGAEARAEAPRARSAEGVPAARSRSAAARVLGSPIESVSPGPALTAAVVLVAALVAASALARLVAALLRARARRRPRGSSLEKEALAACEALFKVAERRGFVLGGAETLLAFARAKAAKEGASARDKALVKAVRVYYAIRFSCEPPTDETLAKLATLVVAAEG